MKEKKNLKEIYLLEMREYFSDEFGSFLLNFCLFLSKKLEKRV